MAGDDKTHGQVLATVDPRDRMLWRINQTEVDLRAGKVTPAGGLRAHPSTVANEAELLRHYRRLTVKRRRALMALLKIWPS